MRLLRYVNDKWTFSWFEDADVPPYAILSHTWGKDEEEVTYKDIISDDVQKEGLAKLTFCRDQAAEDGYVYFWIDTCCINKSDGAETDTAIRSMWRWYEQAAVCYVLLTDVSKKKRRAGEDWEDAFKKSRWFSRGWTLQELVAPKKVEFYATDGRLGSKTSLKHLIQEAGVSPRIHEQCSHLERLSWVRHRLTKRSEDKAYCMMGICGVSFMPMYGEGEKEAQRRLEDAIITKYGTVALREDDEASTGKDHEQGMMERLRFETMESRRTTIRKALARTCKWILSNELYKSWSDVDALHNQHGFFWIKGKPGCGKSVLIKYLDEETAKTTKDDGVQLSFYFNARGEALEKTFIGLYRSLLVQLLSVMPQLRSVLEAIPDDICLNVTDHKWQINRSVQLLQKTFHSAILRLRGKRIHCFIDALDECQESDVEQLVDFLQMVQEDALSHDIAFFVCFASRHYPILEIPTSLQLVLEENTGHQNDLERYIAEKLYSGTVKPPPELKDELLKKSGNIFIWLVLVVDILKKEISKGRLYNVTKRLEETPQDLTALFSSIISRDNENLEDTIMCLKWVLFAKRPLNLTEF